MNPEGGRSPYPPRATCPKRSLQKNTSIPPPKPESSRPSTSNSHLAKSRRERIAAVRHKESPKRRNRRKQTHTRSQQRKRSRSRSRAHTISSNHEDYHPTGAEAILIEALRKDIAEAIRERAEFTKFTPQSISTTALLLVRFGIGNFQELRTTRADQRSHFIADAKKSYGFKSLKMTNELFALSPPPKRGRDIAKIEFDEVHLPRRLENFQLTYLRWPDRFDLLKKW